MSRNSMSTEDSIYLKDDSSTEDYIYINDDQSMEQNGQNDYYVDQIADLNIADCVDKEDSNTDFVHVNNSLITEDCIDIELYSNIEVNSNTEYDTNNKNLSGIKESTIWNIVLKENDQNGNNLMHPEESNTKEIVDQKDNVNRENLTLAEQNLTIKDLKYTRNILPTYNSNADVETNSNTDTHSNFEDNSVTEDDSNKKNVEDNTCTTITENSISSRDYLVIEDNVVNQTNNPKYILFDPEDPIMWNLLCTDVYIDEKAFSKSSSKNDSGKLYSINDMLYFEKTPSPPDKSWIHFEVYSEDTEHRLLASNTEVGASSPSEYDSEDEGSQLSGDEFEVTLQKVPQGYIVNEELFLTDQQWNTVILDELATYKCIVCDIMCEFKQHVVAESHIENLDLYKPLKKYELNMIRKMRNLYHCAICNKIIESPDHCDTEPHGDNLRYAINKVFDIEYIQNRYNNNNSKNDCYHFDADALNNYMGMNDSLFDYSDDDFNDNKTAFPSYASMAKKPKGPELPEFIEKDLGLNIVRVRYDSWHMIISINNKLYCIVCKKYFKLKAQHCSDAAHLRNLNQCVIVEKYLEYFIRTVDDKFYHCGHCNNLQYVSDMDSHIETKHLKKIKLPHTETNPTTFIEIKNKNSELKNIDSEVKNKNCEVKNEHSANNNSNNPIPKKNNTVNDNPLINPSVSLSVNKTPSNGASGSSLNINFYITLALFGRTFLLPNVSYNMINPYDFYCGFCNMRFTETTIPSHILFDAKHVYLLKLTPFLNMFNFHLIRTLKDSYHCAICNVVIQFQHIYPHISSPAHAINLEIALGFRIPPLLNIVPSGLQKPDQNQSNETLVVLNEKTSNVATNTNEVRAKVNNANENTTNKAQKAVNTEHAKRTDEIIEEKTEVTYKMTKAKEEMIKLNKAYVLDDEANLLNESTTSENDGFDTEEYILAKINNNVLKITNSAYNTLTCTGSGSKYCFVCAVDVKFCELKSHVMSRSHIEALEGCKFLSNDKYDGNLLRQSFLLYHCAVCNVLFSRDELDDHLFWLTHMDELRNAQNKAHLKTTDIIQTTVSTTDETVYLHQLKPELKIHLDVEIVYSEKNEGIPKTKLVLFKEYALKINWRYWHSLSEYNDDFRCKMCKIIISHTNLNDHLKNDEHIERLSKPLLTIDNALLRKMTATSHLCITCNLELPSMNSVNSHVKSRKHLDKWHVLINESVHVDNYEDCDDYDVFIV